MILLVYIKWKKRKIKNKMSHAYETKLLSFSWGSESLHQFNKTHLWLNISKKKNEPAGFFSLFLLKADNNIDMTVLEDCARLVLEEEAPRAFAVLRPLKLTITNWPEGAGEEEVFEVPAHPGKGPSAAAGALLGRKALE
jgi:hypothetical protein